MRVFRSGLAFVAAALLVSGCAEAPATVGIEAQQIEGAWVFTYQEQPTLAYDALTTGEASVVDGCFLVGDQVVVWHDEHLARVEEVISAVDQGESIMLKLGGGGRSLDEGSTLDDFPSEVLEHCEAAAIWYSGPDDIETIDPI